MLEITGTIQESYNIKNMCNWYGGITIFRTEHNHFWSIETHAGVYVEEIGKDLYQALKARPVSQTDWDKSDELSLVRDIVREFAPEGVFGMADEIGKTPFWSDGDSATLKTVTPSFNIKKVDGDVIVKYSDDKLFLWMVVKDVGYHEEDC